MYYTICFFFGAELRSIYRNIEHTSVEKQIKGIEAAETGDLPSDTRSQLQDIVQNPEDSCLH